MDFREFFYVQKSDRTVMFTLLTVAAVGLLLFFLLGGVNRSSQLAEVDSTMVDSGAVAHGADRWTSRRDNRGYYYSEEAPGGSQTTHHLFPFDPNTADSTELLSLGLRPWQVRNLYRYRERGGVFRQPKDFARLYGLTLKQYRQLEPYIRIAKEYNMMARDYISDEKPAAPQRDSLVRPQKLSPQERVAVNQADTTLLQRVPGIGPYYARRIVSYRQRLGGYYRMEQLLEIEGFPESALNYFSIADDAVVRKLNVNRLSLNELRQHPYVGYYRAKQIVDFRRTHGRISSLNELSLSKDFTPEVIERLEHYVEY
jgi:DNA uptake protein ComE-like DNA-binding protein